MAGEWIKFEASTPDKREVFAITTSLGWDDPDRTVGKLLKVWRWFDQQTIDGNAPGVTLALLDQIIGVTGFAQSMCEVGWFKVTDCGVMLPNFERHNGKTAKDRALTAKRVAKHKSNAASNDNGNAENVSGALPREEKRRIYKDPAKAPEFNPKEELLLRGVSEQTAEDWLTLRKGFKAKVTKTVLKEHIAEADKAGISLERALATACKRGWRGFEAAWLKLPIVEEQKVVKDWQ